VVVAWLVLTVWTQVPSISPASALREAAVRAAEFDMAGAVRLLTGVGESRDTDLQVAAVYARGLLGAREAAQQGGSPESLTPVRQAIAWLEVVANGRAGPAEIARLMLQAAAAAAQSERDEMRLYLDTAIRMETVQRAAGMAGAPLLAAAETAADLWLQVHRYEEARRAFDEAAQQFGSSPRILYGRARAARGLNDVPTACEAFRQLLDAWGSRPAVPDEISEARAYVAESCVLQGR
jgi:tetratricopeptide (TPR) repeat protein